MNPKDVENFMKDFRGSGIELSDALNALRTAAVNASISMQDMAKNLAVAFQTVQDLGLLNTKEPVWWNNEE